MKRLCAIAVLSGLIISCIPVVKRTLSLEMPDPNAPASRVDIAEYESKYGEYDGALIYHEYSVEPSGTGDFLTAMVRWSYNHIRRTKRIVLNPEAQYLTTFEVGKMPEQAYMIVTAPDGTVKRYGKTDLVEEDTGYGYSNYKFAYPNIVRGTVIEEGYLIKYGVGVFPVLDHEFPLQFMVPCETIKLSYCYPDNWKIYIKEIGQDRTPNCEIIYDVENSKKTVKYSDANVPAVVQEPYSPYFREEAKYLQLMVTGIVRDGFKNPAERTWFDLVENLHDGTLKNMTLKSKEAEHIADSLTRDCETDLERTAVIVAWIRDNIELTNEDYEGLCSKVLKRREGGVFDICALARTMLRRVELRGDIIAIHSATQGYFDPDFVLFDQFATCAVGLKVDDRYVAVFPYAEAYPVFYIPAEFLGQRAIVLDKHDTRFVDITEGVHADNRQEDIYHVTIHEDGSIDVHEEKSVTGIQAVILRDRLLDAKDDEIIEILEEIRTCESSDDSLFSWEILNKDRRDDPLVIKMQYTLDNLITKTADEALLQTDRLFVPFQYRTEEIRTVGRRNPISPYANIEWSKEVIVTFPDTWSVASPLQDVDLTNSFGTIASAHQITDNNLIVSQNLRLDRTHEPKEKIGELVELIGNDSQLNLQTIVFNINELAPEASQQQDSGD